MRELLAYFGHHKCGTRWVLSIVEEICALTSRRCTEFYSPSMFGGRLDAAVKECGIDFLCYTNAGIEAVRQLREYRAFHVIRDPRDLVVSAYFSHLDTHPVDDWPALAQHREILRRVSKDEGLHVQMEFCRPTLSSMHRWDYGTPQILEVKMESLLQDDLLMFTEICRFLGILDDGGQLDSASGRAGITRTQLRAIVHANRFSTKADGRNPGQEDPSSHYRKGVAGDWRNHFGQTHVQHFKQLYNDMLMNLGYETGDAWTAEPGSLS